MATNTILKIGGKKMFEIGRICIKIAGRDAGLKCVVIDLLDKNTVLIDGQTRRRKCNLKHLEPLKETIKIKKNAAHKDVVAAFKKLKIETKETKPKKTAERPKKVKKEKTKLAEEEIKKTEPKKPSEKKKEVKKDTKEAKK